MIKSNSLNRRSRGYLVPNFVTSIGLMCGLFVIFKMNMTEPGMGSYDIVYGSALLLAIAALADFADGALARWMRAQTSFGLVFDSVSDAVTFGVAPAVMVLKTISAQQGTSLSFFATTAATLYALCGILRLVRFSVQKQWVRESQPDPKEGASKYFIGLPIPAAASALVALNLLFSSNIELLKWPFGFLQSNLCLIFSMAILGFLMVSRILFPTLSRIRIRASSSFFKLFLVSIIVGALLYSFFYRFAILSAILTWGYIVASMLRSTYYYTKGQRSMAVGAKVPLETL